MMILTWLLTLGSINTRTPMLCCVFILEFLSLDFTDSELESIRKSLSRSVDRFPESFRHKFLLNHIIKLGEKYRRLLSIENLGNVNVNLPKIQHPLVSSENFLWKDKYKDNSKNLANAGQKKKSNADMTKYVVKKPVYKVSLGNVPVHKESTKNIPMVTKKPVTDSSAASHTDGQARVSLEKLMKKNESEDDSMDSVDIYLTRRTIYSPVANYSRDSGDMHCETVPKSLSPVNSFFEEMEQLNECSSGVSDSDEEKMKVNYDSNYSEISVEEKSCMNWYDTAQTVEGKMKVNCDPNSKTNKVKMDENSEYSALTLSDEEKFDNGEKKLVNNDYLPKIVPKEDTKVSCDLPKTVTDEEKMNVANNNFSPTSAVAHKELVVSLYDCCTTKTNHTSVVPVPMVSAKPKLNAFDILMRKVIPPKRKRFF